MQRTSLLSTVATALLAVTGAAQAQSTTYTIDPSHTFVMFEARHFNTSTVRGRFDKKEGSITVDRTAKTGKAEITIDLASINTGVGPFDGHLKSKDFFNVAENPTAKFVGDKFNFDGTKVTSVDGMLTLNGKSGPASLKATNFNCYENPMLKREVCGGDFETTIARSAWDIKYGVPNIPDNIRLLIQIEAIKQQ